MQYIYATKGNISFVFLQSNYWNDIGLFLKYGIWLFVEDELKFNLELLNH